MRRHEAGRTILSLVAGLALGACSWMPDIDLDKKIDYKSQSVQLPPLEVPPDLTKPGGDERYRVPERGTATYSEYNRERAQQRGTPSGSAVLPQVENARIERDGSQRWLVVKGTPERVWQTVRDFWQEAGFVVNVENPGIGVMETDWAENRATIPDSWLRRTLGGVLDQAHSSSERDKYRTRMERTPTGGTEVYISHRGMVEIYTSENTTTNMARTVWQPRDVDPELEAEFLRRLMVRLGTTEEKAKAMIAAPPPAQRAALKKGLDGQELLEVFEPFDRAWRRVGLALDRVGFTVEDRDRQKGMFFVRYADPEAEMEAKKGMFSWLAFWKSDEPKVKAAQYRVAVIPQSDNSNVRVLDKDGAADSSVTSRRILTLLHEQLK